MPRIDDSTDSGLFYTNNTGWLEEGEEDLSRRCESPEALLTRLEGMIETGELSINDATTYLNDLQGVSR